MTRLHFVKKARKSIRGTNIRKGDSYYWWQFAFSARQVSKTQPRRSQYMTRSDYIATLMDMEDECGKFMPTAADRGDIAQQLRDWANEVEGLGSEQADKLSNMPDSLQQGPTGELLQTRADECESLTQSLEEAADAIDSIDPADDPTEPTETDKRTDDDVAQEIQDALADIDWSYS